MRKQITQDGVAIWLSANDTYEWAHKAGASWPCSTLSGKRLFASFDSNGLNDIAIDGKTDADCDGHEFNAIVSDFMRTALAKDHKCYCVMVTA